LCPAFANQPPLPHKIFFFLPKFPNSSALSLRAQNQSSFPTPKLSFLLWENLINRRGGKEESKKPRGKHFTAVTKKRKKRTEETSESSKNENREQREGSRERRKERRKETTTQWSPHQQTP
jgi:hypothetical protein